MLEQLVQLALTVQLETGRRAVDPQLGLYVDQLGGTTWPRRFRLFSRAARALRPARPRASRPRRTRHPIGHGLRPLPLVPWT
ncbi:hypothetical protein WKI68_41705 [Streptomyces sp. MS1.HAVA.3]|uniref:Uncharacterized protein n=1 Tax=Streptomyces caledonius TaxID=3134107 RepID=A0ABU8UDJ6_9ACTN